jgi:hypothetical protein
VLDLILNSFVRTAGATSAIRCYEQSLKGRSSYFPSCFFILKLAPCLSKGVHDARHVLFEIVRSYKVVWVQCSALVSNSVISAGADFGSLSSRDPSTSAMRYGIQYMRLCYTLSLLLFYYSILSRFPKRTVKQIRCFLRSSVLRNW